MEKGFLGREILEIVKAMRQGLRCDSSELSDRSYRFNQDRKQSQGMQDLDRLLVGEEATVSPIKVTTANHLIAILGR
jgi:hypothetical protein